MAIESNKDYFESYKFNHPQTTTLNEDITLLDQKKIKDNYVNGEEVKGIIGGPPCIGFSSVGNRRADDPRNMLVFYFIKWVEFFKPNFFVMENVKGILTMGKGQVVKKIIQMYRDIGYKCKMFLLLAAEYGVPQLRERVFYVGTKDNTILDVEIKKTHQNGDNNNLPPFLKVKDAFSDILDTNPSNENKHKILVKEYNEPPKTEYQEYLRKNSDSLFEHIAPNHSQNVIERISHIKQGENHGSLPEEYQLKGGYPNIYGRLHLDYPADTITGNCGCVSAPGRFIHPTQNRAISVREAARLQSFPDDYRFFGNMRDMYKQVGNAVPPLLAYHIGLAIKEVI